MRMSKKPYLCEKKAEYRMLVAPRANLRLLFILLFTGGLVWFSHYLHDTVLICVAWLPLAVPLVMEFVKATSDLCISAEVAKEGIRVYRGDHFIRLIPWSEIQVIYIEIGRGYRFIALCSQSVSINRLCADDNWRACSKSSKKDGILFRFHGRKDHLDSLLCTFREVGQGQKICSHTIHKHNQGTLL